MTIQELFKQMTAEEIALFCANVSDKRDIKEFFTSEYEDLHHWVSCAFVWSETLQGHDYWEAIAWRTTTNTIEVNGVEYWTLA